MAITQQHKREKRIRRHTRVRGKVSGTADVPRLTVYKSLKHMYAQLIDDIAGTTIVSAKDAEIKDAKINKTDMAFKVGELLAEKAKKAGISKVVFDKGGFKFHGRVKAVADGARKAGLLF